MTLLRTPARRVEDGRLVTGAGSYVADLVDEETLLAVFVRSTVAHGRLVGVDLAEARKAPGVVAVFGAADLDLDDMPDIAGPGAPEAPHMKRPPLARDTVRFVGEGISVVIAESEAAAVDAAELIWPDIDPLPVASDLGVALSDQVLLFPAAGSNIVARKRYVSDGNPEPGEMVSAVTVDSPRLSPVTIEPLAMLVRPNGEGLDVWCGHQSPGRLPNQLGAFLGIPASSIRVRVPDVGGAFGTKGQFYPEYIVIAAAVLRLGRPVAWIQRRRDQLSGGTHGRGQRAWVELTGDRDGRIRTARMRVEADVGAYPLTGSRIPLFSQLVAPGLYDIPHIDIETTIAVTNRAPVGPYRGAGRPEAALAIERAIDAFARAGGLDPVAVRKLNYIPKEALPFKTVTGALYDSGDYAGALDLAVELADLDRFRAEQEERRQAGADPIGIGLCTFVERAGGAIGTGEYGRVELTEDGSVIVRTGSVGAGQGHPTVWRQLASTVLSVPFERITVISGDSAEVSESVGTFGSRSAQLGGSAIWRTAIEVRDRALKVASDLLEASSEDLVLENGVFRVSGSPDSGVSLAEVAVAARQAGVELAAEEMFDPRAQTFPYGAYIAVVEVEIETGRVSLLRLVAVDDCGNVLNPMIVEGQLHGSVMQGLGQALLEEFRYDEQGQPLTTTLMDYLIPGASQEMPLISGRLTSPAPSNPLGAKGSGEAGCIGAPPAVLNAVLDALAPLGVDNLSFPLTPNRVWTAIQTARNPKPKVISGGNRPL